MHIPATKLIWRALILNDIARLVDQLQTVGHLKCIARRRVKSFGGQKGALSEPPRTPLPTDLLSVHDCACLMMSVPPDLIVHTATQFSLSTVTTCAESVGGTTPGVRVIWNRTVPPEQGWRSRSCSGGTVVYLLICWIIHSAAQFSLSTSAESVGGTTPGVRVTWSTTVPPECVKSLRVEFHSDWSTVCYSLLCHCECYWKHFTWFASHTE